MPNEYSDSLDEQEFGYHRLMGKFDLIKFPIFQIEIGVSKQNNKVSKNSKSTKNFSSSCANSKRCDHLPNLSIFGSKSWSNGTIPTLQTSYHGRFVQN